MRVDTRPRKRNAPRPAEKSAPQFLQWLRGRDCLAATHAKPPASAHMKCAGKVEAAHVDYAGGKGIGTKVADKYAVPFCSYHHRLQHDIGWPRFEKSLWGSSGVALAAAESFWRNWPGRIAWERKQEASGA